MVFILVFFSLAFVLLTKLASSSFWLHVKYFLLIGYLFDRNGEVQRLTGRVE